MDLETEARRAEDKSARREKKIRPKMRVTGRGMKRFAKPTRKKG